MAKTSNATVESDLREISTPKGALRYYDCGRDSGPVLLFLHGSGPGVTGWRNFRGVLPAFAERFRCLVLEFPGFGVSDDFCGHPMVTAFGTVAPVVSNTVPAMFPLVDCATAEMTDQPRTKKICQCRLKKCRMEFLDLFIAPHLLE